MSLLVHNATWQVSEFLSSRFESHCEQKKWSLSPAAVFDACRGILIHQATRLAGKKRVHSLHR
jgi:hypothetical protein